MAVFCFSERDRALLAGLDPAAGEKIRVFTSFPDEAVRPASPAEKEETKATRTQGREYFLADLSGGGEEVVVNLLLAFSLFKKRQHSNMRLVLTGRLSGPSAGIRERLKTYRTFTGPKNGLSKDRNSPARPMPSFFPLKATVWARRC
jgi:hypothetical protein